MSSKREFLVPAPELEPPAGWCGSRIPAAGGRVPAASGHVSAAGSLTPVGSRTRAAGDGLLRVPGSVGLQRVLRSSHPVKSVPSSEGGCAAREFASTTLRLALEVLDGRRPVSHLTPLADPIVVAAVRTLASAGGAPGRSLGTATLTRVNVIMTGTRAAEVCAGYDRGARHFALAARIVRGRSGWRVSAFRVC